MNIHKIIKADIIRLCFATHNNFNQHNNLKMKNEISFSKYNLTLPKVPSEDNTTHLDVLHIRRAVQK